MTNTSEKSGVTGKNLFGLLNNQLIRLFIQESGWDGARLLVISGISAAARIGLLAIVIHCVHCLERGQWVGIQEIILFFACLGLFIEFERKSLALAVGLTQTIAVRHVLTLAGALPTVQWSCLERQGLAVLYERLTKDEKVLATSLWSLVNILQALLIISAYLVFLLVLNPFAGAVILLAVAVQLLFYGRTFSKVVRALQDYESSEGRYSDIIQHIFSGFKEIKLNRRRKQDILKRGDGISDRIHGNFLALNYIFTLRALHVQLLFWTASAVVVFIFPAFQLSTELLAALVIVLCIVEQLLAVDNAMPTVQFAIGLLERFEHLKKHLLLRSENSSVSVGRVFQSLQLVQVCYRYENNPSEFQIGPVNIDIAAGEVIFIVGSNGSGKSTLMKLLCGLYSPIAGEIKINREPVMSADLRRQFTAVFSDYYLFDRLYGITDSSRQQAEKWLSRLGLKNKVSLLGDRFSTTHLSTGQRKRLALVAACLGQHSLVLLDEWTADQDPEFRHYFYREMLPELKSCGRTVIAVTHDDRYFECCDRLLIMDYGKVREL